MDECEDILRHLENDIKGPEARPARITALVSKLPSSTVPAPRVLSASLLDRLNAIADTHNGVIPLHGRLFAQWMHLAYPRECPYPHLAGTTAPQAAFAWMESGQKTQASSDEIELIIEESRNTSKSNLS